ncbi:acyl-CoA dehydrogenase [Roseivivax marinus]|uniref:3-methylmercaptopropionyl-CoA dehydrogenase n=1 Tax=Roseivivax marinus TaxID=1379903 RepID=W4HND5_9RHOB|nr:acyl-CoA dehydrogenase [Roseivivax marinus]ETW13631.1 acyl-CoA dehydrogenase [Roseivivax marinus]
MPYRAPVDEFRFLYAHVVDLAALAGTERFAEATPETVEAILTEAGRLCEEVLAPTRRAGDTDPARLENGVTRTSEGFDAAYGAIAEGGWVAISADPEHGGMGLPMALTTAVNDMVSSANLALQLNPMLTQGQIDALEAHASDELKALYLPKLISGEWTGTMNLTEPQAGSDVGALRTKAEPNGDGTYAITGQKIYITWGDHDLTPNICHLVLARLPDAAPGTKGISLFMVPKYLPTEDGTPGPFNNVRTVSLEEKMGIHGSPTAVLDYDRSTGWLVGPENGGMKAMFTMMNNARLGVGAQGIGVAEGAFQHALAYAMDRRQGASKVENATGSIVDHADVRRMLTTMKADIFAARAIALMCAVALDRARSGGGEDWAARAAFLTPIAKTFGTETGMAVADMGIQVHGGMGYVEETGAAQFLRDVRVTAIYEGTNGIQAMDLVARKMADGGEAAFAMLDEIESFAETARERMPDLAAPVWEAAETLRETVEWLVAQDDLNARFAGSVPFLMGFARVLGGHAHLMAAMADPEGPRARLARFYITRLLPQHAGHLAHARAGAEDLYAVSPDDLAA